MGGGGGVAINWNSSLTLALRKQAMHVRKRSDWPLSKSDCIDYVTEIGNLHMRSTGTPCYGYRP